MVLLITYDLHEPDRDYEDVIATIKGFGSWAHPEESVWLVDTTLSPAQCRSALVEETTDATIFVVPVAQQWAAYDSPQRIVDWLNDGQRRW